MLKKASHFADAKSDKFWWIEALITDLAPLTHPILENISLMSSIVMTDMDKNAVKDLSSFDKYK